MCPHILRRQPAFCFPGLPAPGKLVHQPDGGLCPLIVLYIHDGIPAPAILGQEHGGAHRHVMQDLRVIAQIRDGFDVRHGTQPLSYPQYIPTCCKIQHCFLLQFRQQFTDPWSCRPCPAGEFPRGRPACGP